MMRKRILVFASGTKDGGGSGFRELVKNTRLLNNLGKPILDAEIVAVVSNYDHGGVWVEAGRFGVRFEYFPGPYTAEGYQKFVREFKPDLVVLSGWLKLVKGLDPCRTINIHPGPLPRFGGPGMYGRKLHQAVLDAFRRGEIYSSAVSMHFVTDKYDEGPVFFRYPVYIDTDDPDVLAEEVKKKEHAHQSWVTNLVVHGKIRWDGKDPASLRVPAWYRDQGYFPLPPK